MKKSEILLSLSKAIIGAEERLAKITSTFGVLDHPHFVKAYQAALAEGRSPEEAMAVGFKAYKVATAQPTVGPSFPVPQPKGRQ